jgi:hypothetical protein
VYAAWSIYDDWPADETAIGFARSFNGGATFMPATRILSNIKGIRASLTGKNMRVNSFPCMAVDNSPGPHRGTIYLVWANRGIPGINTGKDIDIYLMRSADQGTSWSDPIRVNQAPPGLGKQHFFPWIACDPVTGGLCVTCYDDRNADTASMATFVSVSYDGGNTWSDMQVSDYTFTPAPIPGLAFSYFGDYIGIQSYNMKVYPAWTDNRDNGRAMTWVSPFDLGPNPGQPWVTYYSDSLSDVAGSGNATLDYGDSLHLSLGLKNLGDQPADSVTAMLTTASPYILITRDTATYGAMAPGMAKVVPTGFTLRVSDTIPDNLVVRFDVSVYGADSSWYSHFAVESHAPALKIGGFTIIDTLDGNRNGRLDPGETVRVNVPLSNTGDHPCLSSWCRFSAVSPFLASGTDSLFAGDLFPGQAVLLSYPVTVSPEAPAGSSVMLSCQAGSGLYRAQRVFRTSICMVVEDWETNTFSKFPWQHGGSKPWTLTDVNPSEGMFTAVSGPIGDNTASQLSVPYESASDDSISFHLSTSSEQDYDFLMFYIDGVLQGQWSGETPWMRAAFAVAAGQHQFKWVYRKDIAVASGQDRAWLDFIAFPSPVLPEVNPGPDAAICAGDIVLLQATAIRCDSIKWSTSGDGIFGNDTALVTTYTPGENDVAAGIVTLRLTGYGMYGNDSGNKKILIYPGPSARITVFPNDSVCIGSEILLLADTAGISAWRWIPGNVAGPEAAYDTSLTGGAGTGQVRLEVSGPEGCTNRDSVFLTFRDCTGYEEVEACRFSLFPNPGEGLFLLEIRNCEAEPLHVSVFNILNQLVYSFDDPRQLRNRKISMDLSFLPEGVYLLSLPALPATRPVKLVISRNNP